MNIVTKAEIRKPLGFGAWHTRRYGFAPLLGCGSSRKDCTHFYACYLTSLGSLRRGKPKAKRRRK